MTDLRSQLAATLTGAYTIERELGGGGMSRVFVADEVRLGRKVVVKVLSPDLAAGISAERFEREIRLAASLQQANIVPVLSAGDTDGLPYFTMPYVEGESLRARLGHGPLSLNETTSILRDVARALQYAHNRGVVHRDIKPDNVLLSGSTAVVTDFGIAKALTASRTTADGTTLTQLGTSIGTPAYMAPEQAAGDPNVDGRADIYALGCMAYELIAGHPPFVGAPAQVMAAHVSVPPPPLGDSGAPASLRRIVMRCLAKDPRARYQTAHDLLLDLDALSTPVASVSSARRRSRGGAWAALAGVIVVAGVMWFASAGWRHRRWFRDTALPGIKTLLDRGQYDSAWMVMRQADEISKGDTSAEALLVPRYARKYSLQSTPAGARVYRASFKDTTKWIYLGTTPTAPIVLPNQVGRLRIEKAGYLPLTGLTPWNRYTLRAIGAPDSDMAVIPGGRFGAFLVGSEGIPPLALPDYLMDRHEVTNRQFQAFVDAGGYTNPEWWPALIRVSGKDVPWGVAVATFRDKTGRPGPSTWEGGDFPAGQADMPVGGVSWYEAKAFAAFVHKDLPTIYHWAHAANTAQARFVVPGGNFQSAGPMAVGKSRAISEYGVLDLAGNVREWCENATGDEQRYILGGGWSDPTYAFTDAYAQPALDRSAINGIRLVEYPVHDATLARSQAPQPRAFRDYRRLTPVSAAEFDGFRHLFDYDHAPLDARVEARDTTDEDYIIERVSLAAAYGGERMYANVYLPRHGTPPYQTIVMFPGSGVISVASSLGRRDPTIDFIPRTGRIAVLPVLKSTFERRDSLPSDVSDSSFFWRDHVVMWVKDMRRTLDYLSTRRDVDTTRFGYFGFSWGSNMAPIVLAVEPRFHAALLYVAGLTMEGSRPEVDPFNYLPYVRQPVLMLNGRYDYFYPVETAQLPFFDNLGTRPPQKQWKIYEGGHDVPRVDLMGQTLAWFDTYLGKVH